MRFQSVGNSVSFLVGPKFSNLVVCIVLPSTDKVYRWKFHIFINGKEQFTRLLWWAIGNYDHVWLIYGKVNISNPSEENRIEVKVTPTSLSKKRKKLLPRISVNRFRIYVECICCPQRPNVSPASSMDQCAFNNGEEDPGRVGIRRRLRRRNHRPIHAACPALDGFEFDSNSGNEATNPGDGDLPVCIHHHRKQKKL